MNLSPRPHPNPPEAPRNYNSPSTAGQQVEDSNEDYAPNNSAEIAAKVSVSRIEVEVETLKQTPHRQRVRSYAETAKISPATLLAELVALDPPQRREVAAAVRRHLAGSPIRQAGVRFWYAGRRFANRGDTYRRIADVVRLDLRAHGQRGRR